MAKMEWKPGNMLYPLPAVFVTVADGKGHDNVLTVAWTSTICTNPPMLGIAVRPERYSYPMLVDTGEFAISLPTEELTHALDFCGVRSGKDGDKFAAAKITRAKASYIGAPLVAESPVNIECRVKQRIALGSHDFFLADVLAVHVEDSYMQEDGRFALEKAKPIVYSHGSYYGIGELLGKFGYSVKKI